MRKTMNVFAGGAAQNDFEARYAARQARLLGEVGHIGEIKACKGCGADFQLRWPEQAYCEACCEHRCEVERQRIAYKGGGNPFCKHAYGDSNECFCGHIRQPHE